MTKHAASMQRLRLLTLVQQGKLDASAIRPPLTPDERAWIAEGPQPVLPAGHPDSVPASWPRKDDWR